MLLSQACKPLLDALPSVPPTTQRPYAGAAATAATRATLQSALDNYKPGDIILPTTGGTEMEARSFGETHASELSRISSVADHHNPPSRTSSPPLSIHNPLLPIATPVQFQRSRSPTLSSMSPVDPSTLNNSPAAIPGSSQDSSLAPISTDPQSVMSAGPIPLNTPTVAETGVPLSGGKEGPGPSSGSLAGGHEHSLSRASLPSGPGYGEAAPSYGASGVPKYGLSDSGHTKRYESAEEEKQRLQREDRELLLRGNIPQSANQASSSVASSSALPQTAEDEKKRLEREERERWADIVASTYCCTEDYFFVKIAQSRNFPGLRF